MMNPPNAKCIVGMLSLLVAGVESFGSFPASFAKGTVTSVSQSVPDFGEMKVVCDHSDKASPKVYLEVDATAWTDLSTVMSGFDVSIPVPPECPPFKHVLASYAVGQAHPPWDGRQFNGEKPGGYGQPHVDVHFFVVRIDERERLTANCTTNIQGPQNSLGQFLQCSQLATDEATLKFFKLPPPEYTTGFAASPEFGDHAVVGHGKHLLDAKDMAPGGVAHCVSDPASANSKAGMGWLDCHSQFLGGAGIGPPGTVPLFTDLNCTCPFWDDGMTAILNVYDGKVLGNEVMPTLGHVKMLRDGALSNPYYEDYPQAAKYDTSGYQPVRTITQLIVETNKFRTGLVLNSEHTTADA